MPLERSNAILDLSDPNIVIGPRKRRPTERLLENGDPLICKKARNKGTLDNRTLSSMLPPAHPRQATNSTESTHGDDTTSDGAEAITVDDKEESHGGDDSDKGSNKGEATDENDDAELGAYSITLVFTLLIDWSISSTPKGVGCTCICFLQASPDRSVYPEPEGPCLPMRSQPMSLSDTIRSSIPRYK